MSCQINLVTMNTYVQSFINNVSVPKTIDELLWYIHEHGWYNIEDILYDDEEHWTVPRWCKKGDVVFFMHAKYADTHLRRLQRELKTANLDDEDDYFCSFWLKKGLRLHHLYGGKIIAIGIVTGASEKENHDTDVKLHWGSTIYADIRVTHLDNPIDISEFRDFIHVSRQSGITGVFGKEFEKLMELVTKKNEIPEYYKTCIAASMPLAKISAENYLKITAEYRHAFMLEAQFRSFYVDHMLKDLGDQKKFYAECNCRKNGCSPAYVDNLILFHDRYLPVEVKLNISLENDLRGQLKKYVHLDWVFAGDKQITPEQMYNDSVLVIDTDHVYFYSDETGEITKITSLDDLQTDRDVLKLRERINEHIH